MKSQPLYSPVRSHQRFKAADRALVLVNRGPDTLPYHIIDISLGGLSFRYLGQKLKRSEIDQISLYHEAELIVEDIPIKAVSDYRLQDSLVPVRRGSVSFSELDQEKLQKLEDFIARFTVAPLKIAS